MWNAIMRHHFEKPEQCIMRPRERREHPIEIQRQQDYSLQLWKHVMTPAVKSEAEGQPSGHRCCRDASSSDTVREIKYRFYSNTGPRMSKSLTGSHLRAAILASDYLSRTAFVRKSA